MAYNETATYTSDDLDNIIVDFIGTYAVQFVTFASLIALAIIWIYLRKRVV